MSQRERMRQRQSEFGRQSAMPEARHTAAVPIRVHIEHVLVDGLAASDRERFANSLQAGLAQLLVQQGMPLDFPVSLETNLVTTEKVSLSAAIPAEAVGRQVARAVYGGITQLQLDRKQNASMQRGNKTP
jgi:hypothetical protein